MNLQHASDTDEQSANGTLLRIMDTCYCAVDGGRDARRPDAADRSSGDAGSNVRPVCVRLPGVVVSVPDTAAAGGADRSSPRHTCDSSSCFVRRLGRYWFSVGVPGRTEFSIRWNRGSLPGAATDSVLLRRLVISLGGCVQLSADHLRSR